MKNTFLKIYIALASIFISNSCATFDAQFSESYTSKLQTKDNSEIVYSLFLIGDAGNSKLNESTPAIISLEKKLAAASENSSVIFLGDNIYPVGMPSKKKKKKRKLAEHRIKTQTDILKNYKGNSVFIPGNHDWYNNGPEGLKRQQNFIEDQLNSKKVFSPENGCPLDKINLTDDIVLITIDSQWFLEDWDKHPTINDDCPYIKSKRKFFEEFKGMLNKNAKKNIVIAIHHPVFTNGTHGGKYSAKSHLFPINNYIPLPGLGSFANLLRKTSGLNPQDLQNKHYTDFANKIATLTQPYKKVVFVSGHDHNLQYLVKKNKPQIISGAGSKKSATRLGKDNGFTYGHEGYAKLNFYKDGSSKVVFFSTHEEKEKKIFETLVFKKEDMKELPIFEREKRKTIHTSIYSKETTDKSKFYKFLWGEHYRKYYSEEIEVPLVLLDTLYGGLTPVKKGGGNQSNSIRLEDKNGKQYVMRALKKSATRFLQSVAFQNEYVTEKFNDTQTEDLLLDFYTSAHPYTPFVVDNLSKPIDVYHTNPKLFFIPKQSRLGEYNDEFGDALYMIEERAASGHGGLESFGKSNTVISTDDLFRKIRKDKDHIVDEKAYIRARLFDLLIGDWDRHADQWRWAEFKINNKTIYRPIPRDRDQAFSNYDGLILTTITRLIPSVRLMQTFDKNIRSIKWFSDEPYPLDLAFIQSNNHSDWIEQASYIQTHLTDKIIEDAFNDIPNEVKDETIEKIKKILKHRKKQLQITAKKYSDHLHKFVTLKGTDKDDWFEVQHLPNRKTEISYFNIKNKKKGKLIRKNTYDANETKEIWIYGLDDDDHFEISGRNVQHSKIRFIGGQNKDTYVVKDNPNVTIHDFKSKKSHIDARKKFIKLSNSYDEHVYNYRKTKKSIWQLMPAIGVNPDDGLRYGITASLTNLGFRRNPFSKKHSFTATYYNATTGFELNYNGEFATRMNNWNFAIDALFTSPNYSINFFDFGNETKNDDNTKGLDYNRVKLETTGISPALVRHSHSGAKLKIALPFESIEIEETVGRITSLNKYGRQFFGGIQGGLSFEHYDNISLPTLGFAFDLTSGWRTNLNKNRDNSYLKTMMSFVHKLNNSGTTTLSTKLKGHFVFQDKYELYQAASIGGDDGLRGFRNQRFTGKQSFYQNTDLRFTLKEKNTSLVPISYGITLGYDYGRVWLENENSNNWHDSYGGSIWLNAIGMATGNLAVFNSSDGIRISFGMGFGF